MSCRTAHMMQLASICGMGTETGTAPVLGTTQRRVSTKIVHETAVTPQMAHLVDLRRANLLFVAVHLQEAHTGIRRGEDANGKSAVHRGDAIVQQRLVETPGGEAGDASGDRILGGGDGDRKGHAAAVDSAKWVHGARSEIRTLILNKTNLRQTSQTRAILWRGSPAGGVHAVLRIEHVALHAIADKAVKERNVQAHL